MASKEFCPYKFFNEKLKENKNKFLKSVFKEETKKIKKRVTKRY